jgi:NhaA family Na+:H+ antiporter
MAIFFFVVGMEIKREVVAGELSSLRKAALPISAALGGMILPGLIYFWINPSGPAVNGWAIPMATDIAFAVGVLALLGPRVPLSLKIFLLALAIVDDLGAVLVIATFYTEEIRTIGFYIAGGGVAAVLVFQHFGLRSYFWYVPIGIIVWIGMLYSGVHATVAGVVVGLLTPYTFSAAKNSNATFSPLDELIHFLHPWVSFGIMPIFALANAGIPIGGVDAGTLVENPVSMGVGLGLLVGKPVGILLASIVVVGLGAATIPSDLKWRHLAGVSSLAGIGFTMAIFITNLSLPVEFAIDAKIAILIASILSAVIGYLMLAYTLDRS